MSSTVSTDVLTTLQLSPLSANCSEVFQRCPISVIYSSIQKGLLSTYIVLLCFQIQKFALRFSTSCETETFINALKVNVYCCGTCHAANGDRWKASLIS